jgi:hypothetical protein
MKTFLPAAFAAVFMIAGSSMAEAGWKRSGTVVGPYGGVTSVQGSGSCANGTCSSTQTWTGPYGGTTVRKGKRVCIDGVCTYSSTLTGPAGRSVVRSGTISRQ